MNFQHVKIVRVITFKIDDELLEVIDFLALRKGLYRSDIIRVALRQFILKEIERGILRDLKKIILKKQIRF